MVDLSLVQLMSIAKAISWSARIMSVALLGYFRLNMMEASILEISSNSKNHLEDLGQIKRDKLNHIPITSSLQVMNMYLPPT